MNKWSGHSVKPKPITKKETPKAMKQFASEFVAKRRIGIIIHSVDLLKTMPYLGHKDEDFTHIREYRYLVVLSYKIYYFIENDCVYIASIWDCRQGGNTF